MHLLDFSDLWFLLSIPLPKLFTNNGTILLSKHKLVGKILEPPIILLYFVSKKPIFSQGGERTQD